MKTAGKKKITVGFVIQTFDEDNKCIKQEFVAGDEVYYEDDDGNRTEKWDRPPYELDDYQPFDMVQPGDVTNLLLLSERFTQVINRIARQYGLAEIKADDLDIEERLDYLKNCIENRTERLAELKARLDVVKKSNKTVPCKFCHKQVSAITAHVHNEGYVGDECCWDERLRSSE